MNMTSCEWSLFLNALAIAISKDKKPTEIAFLALLFSNLASQLALLAAPIPNEGTISTESVLSTEAVLLN
jgi:hypothetical protein